ncbi:hypothetical protein YC2023_060588 [Brassica napus]
MVDSEDRYFTEKASTVQSTILCDCDREALSKSIRPRQSCSSIIKLRCCPELVQLHGFRSVEVLLDTPPGSPKNCPEAKRGSVRVQISLSRPVNFFMMKPRFCSSRDQSSPVQSIRPLGFGQVLSDQPAASRLEQSGGRTNWADLLVVMLVLRVICHIGRTTSTSGAKPAHARHVLGWTSVSSPSYSAGSRKPLIRWIGKTQIDGEDRILPIERRNTKSPGPRLECRVRVFCWVLTLSPKSGLGSGLGLVCIWLV